MIAGFFKGFLFVLMISVIWPFFLVGSLTEIVEATQAETSGLFVGAIVLQVLWLYILAKTFWKTDAFKCN